MKKIYVICLFGLFVNLGWGQTMSDTIFNTMTAIPVVIDGQADEDCWVNAEWHAIDQVWIPYNASMKDGDFSGRFKVSWDADYLYLLIEVVDDMLSDDHANPLSNWWDDDCLEIFVDENRSMGDHERNCNAFAYHVSLFYDAVDLNSSGQGINYKDNIIVEMDTVSENTYLWELAIKNYDASFTVNDPEASRVYLEENKLMGLAVAYCDNDETTSRENFIGSMQMNSSTANDMYKNADHFGPMLLVTPEIPDNISDKTSISKLKVYPIPAKNTLAIDLSANETSSYTITISTPTGQIVYREQFVGIKQELNIESISNGIYLLEILSDQHKFSRLIIKE